MGDAQLSARALSPYVLSFATVWAAGEVIWRIAILLVGMLAGTLAIIFPLIRLQRLVDVVCASS